MLWFFLTLQVLLQRWCLTCHCVHTLTPRGNRERPESGIYFNIFEKTQYLINTLYLTAILAYQRNYSSSGWQIYQSISREQRKSEREIEMKVNTWINLYTGCLLNIVFFLQILIYIPDSVFSRCQCVYTHKAGRTPALQQNLQSSQKSENFNEKHNI